MKDSPPDILYHYCSEDAFLSIINSKTLWLSDLSKSNDPNEGKIAIERLNKWLHEKHDCSPAHLKFVRECYKHFASSIICLGISFTETEDSSDHWKEYGGNGQGISIGFSSEWLKSTGGFPNNSTHSTARLIPIYYSEENQYRPIAWHVSNVARNLKSDLINDNPHATNAYANICAMGSEILYQFKNDSHDQERE